MAGGFNASESDDGLNEINVVPLVDIVLVLLIIFMVTAQFLVRPPEPPPGMEIELPAAASGEALNESLLAIVINREGDYFLNGEESSLAAIEAHVKANDAQKLEAMIAADKGLAHGVVVTLMDRLRLLGVERFGLNTRPQEIE